MGKRPNKTRRPTDNRKLLLLSNQKKNQNEVCVCQSMLEEASMTNGTGVPTARNIQRTISIKRHMSDHLPTFANNVQLRKNWLHVNAKNRQTRRTSGLKAKLPFSPTTIKVHYEQKFEDKLTRIPTGQSKKCPGMPFSKSLAGSICFVYFRKS
jgi:hypothetical protein